MIGPDIEPTQPSAARGGLRMGFARLAVAGSDPRRDALLAVETLLAPAEPGAWEFNSVTTDGADASEVARAQLARGDLECLIVPERHVFAAWLEQLQVDAPDLLGLDELARFLSPGSRRELDDALLESSSAQARIDALEVRELPRVLARLVESFLSLDERALGVVGRAWSNAAEHLADNAADASWRFARLAKLIDRPSVWANAGEALFGSAFDDLDGRLSRAVSAVGDIELGLEGLEPRWRAHALKLAETASLPPHRSSVEALDPADQRRVDEALRQHLPELSGTRAFGGGELALRPSQAEVANNIAESLGARELLLVHAPTGTGKTLAYLVPALLFAVRNGIRVGVATYTRALQRQAFERDVPLALALLDKLLPDGADSRDDAHDSPRVALLKGRQNYLCWRALLAAAPRPEDSAERWLAWSALLLFALRSDDGDLDQLPTERAFGALDFHSADLELARLARTAAARSGCCTRSRGRETCGAEVARHRAERSHVVITNHAFTLARREFFKHLIFDECEHLHDQAHSAFSHEVTLESTQRLLENLYPLGKSRRRSGRRPLERVARAAVPGSHAEELCSLAVAERKRALQALKHLTRELRAFDTWRNDQLHRRQESDAHSLLREYVENEVDWNIVDAHLGLTNSTSRIERALAALAEELDSVPLPGRERVRTLLERERTDLAELGTALDAWMPLHEGRPCYRDETFYDAERHPRRGWTLAARVLLPNEFLGRYYYPELESAVLISATTYLGRGFEAATRYLGLDRAIEPSEDEAREPSSLRTVRAEEAFDYTRVLVGVPDDAPDYRAGKAAWLDYTARFLAHTAERTQGRLLALFTNAEDCADTGRRLEPFFAERGITCLYQGQPGKSSEQLAAEFRSTNAAVLFGLDTFWFGADFKGEALEYVVIAKLPYGAPDRYHHAQSAVLGGREQRSRIYMPRALARFRQGFGRLMRSSHDRGCVFLLDSRVTEPRHKRFLRELPIGTLDESGAQLVRLPTDALVDAALTHMAIKDSVEDRGLLLPFASTHIDRSRAHNDARPTRPQAPNSMTDTPF